MTDTTLPPEVAEAIKYVDGIFDDADNGEWSTVRTHFHRVAEENARLKARIAEARRVMLGTYPAHGSGYVQIVCDPAKGVGDETFALLKLEDGE